MPRPKSPPLSINQAYELSPGTKDTPVWVNGLVGVVTNIQETRAGAADIWKVTLQNEGGGRSITAIFWDPPRFDTGDVIEISGNGARRAEFKGEQQVSLSRNNLVNVLRSAGPNSDRLPPANRAPRDDSRGGGGDPDADRRGDVASMDEDADRATAFHQKMGAFANLYLQCLNYARRIDTTLKTAGKKEMIPEHFQTCVHTLFIAAEDRGLGVAPPPWVGKTTKAAAPLPPPPPKPAPVDDDSVPF